MCFRTLLLGYPLCCYLCHFICLFSGLSTARVKDETPDNWDEDQEEEEQKKMIIKDKDLEFLFQDVVRDGSLDDYLKRDLQSKQTDYKYKEMLVGVFLTHIKSDIYNWKNESLIEVLH